VGTGVEVSIKELSELVALVEGYEGKILFDTSKPDGTPRKLTDPSKLQALGWRHKVNVDEGVRRLFEWYKNTL
jgi:GDP-L-fucose synthase